MAEFIPTRLRLPKLGERVDWIAPSGEQITGGRYDRLWFLPGERAAYVYYKPIAWRHAEEKADE